MTREVVALRDGSVVLATVDARQISATQQPVERALDAIDVATEISRFMADTVSAGITFELLKIGVLRLIDRFHLRPMQTSASAVRDAVRGFLSESGYVRIVFTQVKHVQGEGWTTAGVADDAAFRTMCDEAGVLLHIQIG